MHNKITTEKIKITNTGTGSQEALDLTEHMAGVMGLKGREKIYARLLGEELLSMVRAIVSEFKAEYWLEWEGRNCTYHLDVQADIDYGKKRELISASSKGINTARRGIMERIRDIVQAGLYSMEEGFNIQAEYGTGLFSYGAIGMIDMGVSDAIYSWSMQKYKSDVDGDMEARDELEKSIIANIADEVKVGINREGIEIAIYKDFA